MRISLGISTLILAITFMAIACDKLNWEDPDRGGRETPCIDESKINRNAGCYEIYAPVCGCDGKTYGNDCEAKNAGVTRWTEGACDKESPCIDESKVDPTLNCPEVIDFVCGCDGETYNNGCDAERNGVTKYRKGRCDKNESDCIDESKIRRAPCPANIDPVCGCDGETYNNACEAENAGVTRYKKGRCN